MEVHRISRYKQFIKVNFNELLCCLAKNNAGWSKIETKLGTSLPEDYKNFIKTYGTGGIDNFIWILTPFCLDLRNQALMH